MTPWRSHSRGASREKPYRSVSALSITLKARSKYTIPALAPAARTPASCPQPVAHRRLYPLRGWPRSLTSSKMSDLKKLIHEIHRRSLWQVLSIYLAVSWGSLQVVQTVVESADLPEWLPGLALVLLLIGFPIVIATAFVQEGAPGLGMRSVSSPGPGEFESPSAPAGRHPTRGCSTP